MTRRTPLVLLQVANLAGGTGNSTVAVVVPWLVLDMTGSPATAGLVAAATAVPGVVMAPLVGAMIDRLGRRRVSVGSDLLSAASVAALPLVAHFGALTLGAVVALFVLGAAFDPAGYTARKSLIPDVCRAAGVDLARINGIHEGVFSSGWILGPMLGAAGIAALGPVGTLWVATIAFCLAAAAVAGIRVTEEIAQSRAHAGEELERFWSTALRGLAVMRADRPLWVLNLAVALLIMVYMPTEQVLLPTYFMGLDQPGSYGLVLTSIAAGAMMGSFAYGSLSLRFSQHRIAVVAMASMAASVIPMALQPPMPVFIAAGFLLGMGWGPIPPLLNTVIQQRVPAHVQGRVYGVQMAMWYAAPPIGLLVVGVAVERFGVRGVYLVVAITLAALAATIATMPSLRDLDRESKL